MTGNGSSVSNGLKTLSVRQSSLMRYEPGPGIEGCKHAGPYSCAERIAGLSGGGCGARQRSDPTGAEAYGIPLKEATPASTAPSACSSRVRTNGNSQT